MIERERERERVVRDQSWIVKFHIPYFPLLQILFRYDRKVEHYRVRRDDRAWVTVDDEEYFENLFKLVEVKCCSTDSIPYLYSNERVVIYVYMYKCIGQFA